MNKQDLIHKLKKLEGLTADEKAALINLVNTKKKYGLVWEDKPEKVEYQLQQFLPVLKEIKQKAIVNKINESDGAIEVPNHILIEGDNLHALTALSFTHKEKVDVIYIDPPYNTGKKDFRYHDAFKDEPEWIDKEHNFRHSTWLSFIEKRLQIAKKLIKDTGTLYISIDDNEKSQLKLLCDEIFGTENFIACLPRVTKASGKTTNKIALNHDYVLVYCKNKSNAIIEGLEHNDKGFKYKDEHVSTRGFYKLNQTLDYDSLQYSPTLDYEIQLDGIKLYPGSSYDKYLERKEGKYNRADWAWRWSKDLFDFGLKNDFIVLKRSKKGSRIYTKTYLNATIEKDQNAKKDLDIVLKQSTFDYPKPLSLIKTILKTNPDKNLTIMDFFAGSGTTLHATIELNDQDGGDRQCILVTNNENNICEEVTYERNKRVIEGFTNTQGNWVDGLKKNNLRYYRCDFVPSTRTEANKRLLTQASTELLQIKESCYFNLTEDAGFKQTLCGIFTNGSGKYMIVIYHSRNQHEVCEKLVSFIYSLPLSEKIKLYSFSPEKETIIADFSEVADKIDAVPLPEAIYNAYKATFRLLKLDRKVVSTKVSEFEDTSELFNSVTVD
jgi:adenine-specific DNA-methyltransferase